MTPDEKRGYNRALKDVQARDRRIRAGGGNRQGSPEGVTEPRSSHALGFLFGRASHQVRGRVRRRRKGQGFAALRPHHYNWRSW